MIGNRGSSLSFIVFLDQVDTVKVIKGNLELSYSPVFPLAGHQGNPSDYTI